MFRRAPQLRDVPAHVRHEGPRRALDAARTAWFSAEEWEAYDRESVALQDARGALSFAERRGREMGVVETLAAVCEARLGGGAHRRRARRARAARGGGGRGGGGEGGDDGAGGVRGVARRVSGQWGLARYLETYDGGTGAPPRKTIAR